MEEIQLTLDQYLELRKFALSHAVTTVMSSDYPGSANQGNVVLAAEYYEKYLLGGPKKEGE